VGLSIALSGSMPQGQPLGHGRELSGTTGGFVVAEGGMIPLPHSRFMTLSAQDYLESDDALRTDPTVPEHSIPRSLGLWRGDPDRIRIRRYAPGADAGEVCVGDRGPSVPCRDYDVYR
jgi:hypothetical protein